MELSGLPQDMGKFRTPSLRNIAVTAPYMHDGSVATLEAVLDIKVKGTPSTSKPLALTPQDKADLIAFLKTLTDSAFLTNPAFADPFTQKN
jgi:cytochrome c peroxidase